LKREEFFVVIVVRNHIFATTITAENHEDSSIDWRISELKGGNLIDKQANLPDIVRQQCLSIVNYFRLNYPSIDFIKDPHRRYFSLELNPNGQWAWIEQIVGYPIRDAIIDTLLAE